VETGSDDEDADRRCAPEIVPTMLRDLDLQGQAWMNLDRKNAVIILNILPLAASTKPSDRESLLVMCSMFRLLATATRIMNDGSVEDIDGLLGCPLYMYKVSSVGGEMGASALNNAGSAKDVDDGLFRDFFCALRARREQQIVTLCTFMAVNFARECLNAFASSGVSVEMAVKLRQRLRDLVSLESKLNICLELCPEADLPNLNQPARSMRLSQLAVVRAKAQVSKKQSKLVRTLRAWHWATPSR
jgi:hypothetical protein